MDTLTFTLDLVSRAGIPGLIAYLLITRIETRLDALTAAVLSLPQRISQCPSPPKSEPPA
jgi:hypothetical protein